MRKLAPAFLIAAFFGTNALATPAPSTTASPTVSPNTTNQQNQSYSDKSNTSPGTNATMDDKSKPMTASTTDEDVNLNKTKKKVKKAKIAAHTDATVKSDAMKSDASVSSSPMTSTNPPTKTTDAAAANSTTGRSSGQ